MTLTENNIQALKDTAAKLKIPTSWLAKLISFESKYNPQAQNPFSSARGLIQFIDSTARELGYRDSMHLTKVHPTFNQQLKGPVYEYLSQYGPHSNEQSLYMSVFYPAARLWNPTKEFPLWVQKVNPGIKNPRDYVRKVNLHSNIEFLKKKISPMILISIIAYILIKGVKHGTKA